MNNFFTSNIFAWTINAIFLIIIFIVFYKAMISLKKGDKKYYVEYAPSLMTSLGLFGTFVGVFIGLLNFDSRHIDGSIQQLLNGLQTAFITSIIGMLFTIIFKVKYNQHMDAIKMTQHSSSQENIEPKDIHKILVRQYDALVIIAKGIRGTDERSLVGQLQILHTDIVYLHTQLKERQENFEKRLWKKLENFSEIISRPPTQKVIEALKEVIINLNEKLTEQLGENFKHLDKSVKNLVSWQDSYMNQLNKMIDMYSLGVNSISATKIAVESIGAEISKMPLNIKLLNDVLAVNQNQINNLTIHLDAFISMKNQAIIAVPNIQKKLEEIGEQLEKGARQVNVELIKNSKQMEDSVIKTSSVLVKIGETLCNQSIGISNNMKNTLNALELNIDKISNGVTATISNAMNSVECGAEAIVSKSNIAAHEILISVQESTQATIAEGNRSKVEMQKIMDTVNISMLQHTDRSLIAIEKQVQEIVSRTNEAVNSQLKQLDQALSSQLNAALEELGASLATIAHHLVDSYDKTKK